MPGGLRGKLVLGQTLTAAWCSACIRAKDQRSDNAAAGRWEGTSRWGRRREGWLGCFGKLVPLCVGVSRSAGLGELWGAGLLDEGGLGGLYFRVGGKEGCCSLQMFALGWFVGLFPPGCLHLGRRMGLFLKKWSRGVVGAGSSSGALAGCG